MDDVPRRTGGAGNGRPADEWAEMLARTVAHLAAQLTINQIRLRALATELAERDVVAAEAVRARVRAIAAETGRYLRENLGAALVDLIDVDALEADLAVYLSGPATD
jgi:hypothetical protein